MMIPTWIATTRRRLLTFGLCRPSSPPRQCLSSSSSATNTSHRPVNLNKVLVANRGEIACRVLRTCRSLGIPTVALYSVADGPDCRHATMADEALLIGTGPTPNESYLLQNEILHIAQQTGANALHPGYGFLSENAHFCNLMTAHDIRFIGPPVSAIQSMGSKSASKKIMDVAGVPTTPGYFDKDETSVQDAHQLYVEATKIGFPVLIKAVMGGGGKGMRLVWEESMFMESLESCQREAQNAFGDSRVLLEKYLVNPRHVEVQIMADTCGNTVHLFERDCSLQRRHQKIIEEAPASDLPEDLRARLGSMGVKAAQAVGYVNAGTVEFLLERDQFYFCEMNTRLQVEHPISELITGIDLVEWQLRIAAGEPLPKTQAEITCSGHAMEARIYAENPSNHFLPATGSVWHHQTPAPMNQGVSKDGVRVDTGLGKEVSVYYDPMISKLIVHGQDRMDATNKLIEALKNYQIAGVPTNIDFLIQCAKHPTFNIAGGVHTGFLDDFTIQDLELSNLGKAAGAFAVLCQIENRSAVVNKSPWSSHWGSWRMGGSASRAQRTLHLVDEGGAAICCTSNRDGSFDIVVDGTSFHVDGAMKEDGFEIVVDSRQRIPVTSVLKEDDGIVHVRLWPQGLQSAYFWSMDFLHPLKPQDADSLEDGMGEGLVKAPMPGKISRLNFQTGDKVKAGDVVLVMEAMKMEHPCSAPCSGTITEMRFPLDSVVDDGAVLFVVESDNELSETTG